MSDIFFEQMDIPLPWKTSLQIYVGNPSSDGSGKKCVNAVGEDLVIVATDDQRIEKHCC